MKFLKAIILALSLTSVVFVIDAYAAPTTTIVNGLRITGVTSTILATDAQGNVYATTTTSGPGGSTTIVTAGTGISVAQVGTNATVTNIGVLSVNNATGTVSITSSSLGVIYSPNWLTSAVTSFNGATGTVLYTALQNASITANAPITWSVGNVIGFNNPGYPTAASSMTWTAAHTFSLGATINGTATLGSTTNALVLTNGSGVVSGYAGSACTGNNLVASISTTGTVICAAPTPSTTIPTSFVSSLAAGNGISVSGATGAVTVTALTSTALWNAASIQGKTVSSSAPTAGDLLQFDGTIWQHNSTATALTGYITSTPALARYHFDGNLYSGTVPATATSTPALMTTNATVIDWFMYSPVNCTSTFYLQTATNSAMTGATIISGTDKPNLNGQSYNSSTALTGWTTANAKGTFIQFVATSTASGCSWIDVGFDYRK